MTVAEIQRALLARGYDLGKAGADGIWGRASIAAARAFQKANKLKVDGVVGDNTLAALGLIAKGTSAPALIPAWYALARTKMGLSETRNHAELQAFLKSDGATLGDPAKLPWCFAGNIEILTEDGWQRFDEITATRVAQVNEAGAVTFTEYVPVRKTYDGNAYRIEGSAFVGTCDAGHRWWGSWNEGVAPRFGTLDRLTTAGLRLRMPHSGAAGVEMSDHELGFIAAFMSDGFVHRGNVEFQVSKQRKIAALMAHAPAHTYVSPRAYGLSKTPLTVLTFDVPETFSVFSEYKVLSRRFVNDMSQEQCQAFLSAYAKFDGNVRAHDGRVTLYTSSSTTRDDLITIATLAGYWPAIEAGGKSDLTKAPSWRIGFTPRTGRTKRITKQDVHLVPFSGEMFCVQVPDGRIVVRGENREPCVTGNCGDFIETCIALTLPEERMVANPYFALNWLKFGRELKTPAVGAILAFQRPGGGHVGFYVGERSDAYHVLGGNQSNSVSESWVLKTRCRGIRWPETAPLPTGGRVASTAGGALSTNEA